MMTEEMLKNYLDIVRDNDEYIHREDETLDMDELWDRFLELHQMCNKLLSIYYNEDE